MRLRVGCRVCGARDAVRGTLHRVLTVGLLLSVAPAARPQSTDRELEALLDMGLDELAQVEVTTASKRPESLALAPATVRVITEEQIRERGYLTLEQALADLPGMQLRDTIGLNSYVFVRGVPNQNNLALVLIDGIQINELNSGGFYGGGQYNLSNVKRIEVVYGPTSALYGANAVSGVINVITKDPRDAPGLRPARGLLLGGLVLPSRPVGRRVGDHDRADRGGRLLVEHRLEGGAAVERLPHAAAGRADPHRQLAVRHVDGVQRGDAAAHRGRTDVANAESRDGAGVESHLRRLGGEDGAGQQGRQCEILQVHVLASVRAGEREVVRGQRQVHLDLVEDDLGRV